MKEKKALIVRYCVLVLALMIGLLCTACSASTEQSQATEEADVVSSAEQTELENEEAVAVPLSTKYMILSYPIAWEDEIEVVLEDLEDGQKITFLTQIGGESLEVFCFTLGTREWDGYKLGVLQDETEGDVNVYVDVHEYPDGNWDPEDYNRLNRIQEQVNEIIIQFYSDARFVPA